MILGHFLKFGIVDVAMAVSRQKTVESWKELKKRSIVILYFDATEWRKHVPWVLHIHESNQALLFSPLSVLWKECTCIFKVILENMFLWSLYLKKNDFENQVSHANFNGITSVGVISSLLPHLFLNPLEEQKDKGGRLRNTRITSFLLIRPTLEKVEHICGQMDFLILSPHIGRTCPSGHRQSQTTASLHTG